MFLKKYKQEKNHFLLLRTCVYLVVSAGRSISRFFDISLQIFGVLRLRGLNLWLFKNKYYRAYDRFQRNGHHSKIPTKKEPITMLAFTSKLLYRRRKSRQGKPPPTLSSRSRSATDYHNIFCSWMIIELIMCLTVSTIVVQSLIMSLEISHVQRYYWHRIWVKCFLLSLLRAYWTQADQSAPQAKWHTIVDY